MEHTYENCHNLTCKSKSRKDGAIIVLDELASEMKYRDEDCGDPPNAVDRGYHLAVQHMMETIEILKKNMLSTEESDQITEPNWHTFLRVN